MHKWKWLVVGFFGAAIVISLLLLADSKRVSWASLTREPSGRPDQSEPDRLKDDADSTDAKKRPPQGVFASLGTDQQFEEAILDGSKLDDFILLHIPRAKSGDADSAYYLAEALRYCSMELEQFDMSFAYYDKQDSDASSNLEHQVQIIMDGLIGKPEFYRRQVRRHLDRAMACKSLDIDSQDLHGRAESWSKQAKALMQPIALARGARLSPRNASISAEKLNSSKAAMRDALSRSKNLVILLSASSVAAVATGRDFTTERLAWAILACNYEDCGTLNYLYLGKCEAMVLQGSSDCSEQMSDLDYLRLKYPNHFDVARGRASELYEALEKGDWSTVGLN